MYFNSDSFIQIPEVYILQTRKSISLMVLYIQKQELPDVRL